jgi:hypothetical protein
MSYLTIYEKLQAVDISISNPCRNFWLPPIPNSKYFITVAEYCHLTCATLKPCQRIFNPAKPNKLLLQAQIFKDSIVTQIME